MGLIEEEAAGLVDGEVVDLVCFGFGQVYDSFDVLVHGLSSGVDGGWLGLEFIKAVGVVLL